MKKELAKCGFARVVGGGAPAQARDAVQCRERGLQRGGPDDYLGDRSKNKWLPHRREFAAVL
eukprot:gene10315-52462_t